MICQRLSIFWISCVAAALLAVLLLGWGGVCLVLSLWGAVLNIYKDRAGFLLWIIANLGWIAWAVAHGAWSQVPMWLAFTGTAWWGWRKWSSDERRRP